jgi:hypothetical protein
MRLTVLVARLDGDNWKRIQFGDAGGDWNKLRWGHPKQLSRHRTTRPS